MKSVIVVLLLSVCSFIKAQNYITITDTSIRLGDILLIYDERNMTNVFTESEDYESFYYDTFDTLLPFFYNNNMFVFEIGVFTDCRGDSVQNIYFSEQVAKSIYLYLTDVCNLPDSMFVTKGYGSSVPFVVYDDNEYFKIGTVLDCNYMRSIDEYYYKIIDTKESGKKARYGYRLNRRVEFKVISTLGILR